MVKKQHDDDEETDGGFGAEIPVDVRKIDAAKWLKIITARVSDLNEALAQASLDAAAFDIAGRMVQPDDETKPWHVLFHVEQRDFKTPEEE